MAVKRTCGQSPMTQILYSLAQLASTKKTETTFLCMGPGMKNTKRAIYKKQDFIASPDEMNEYTRQIIELIKSKDEEMDLRFTFDFLFKAPERKILSEFGIHDYQQNGIEMIYEGFVKETLKQCKGDINNLRQIRLPINQVFLRINLIGFEPEKIEFKKSSIITQHKMSNLKVNTTINNESKVSEYYESKELVSNLNGKIINANKFFELLREQGIKLEIDGKDLDFETYMLYTLSGNNPEGTIKIPHKQTKKSKIISLNNSQGQVATS